jgi:hypothetical protein
MTDKQLASKILQYRTSSSLIVPGTLFVQIGSDAMKEALDRRWVEPDMDTGYLRLASSQSKIEEMQALAEGKCDNCKCDPCECCEKCGKHPCACPKSEDLSTRNLMTAHTNRHVLEYTSPPGYASGQGERGAAVTPINPQPLSAPRAVDPVIGEDVIIADEGKSYQAKIASKNQDGTFKLSFGPNRPAKDRFYRKEEFQRADPGNVQVQR